MPYENELNPEDGPLHEDPVKNLRKMKYCK